MLSIDLKTTHTSKSRKIEVACKAVFKENTTTAIYGKSGAGKTSVLRMIAGLDQPDKGTIFFNDEVWFDSDNKINLPIAKRDVSFVFQDYNLFPNMTIEQNLKYAASNGKIGEHILELLRMNNLTELLNVYPADISNGQRQRMAIVRALCQNPQLLLLDEPFSALDDETIYKLIQEIKIIQQSFNITILIVSHRQDVIFEMAQEVVHIKEDGSVVVGNPVSILKKLFQ